LTKPPTIQYAQLLKHFEYYVIELINNLVIAPHSSFPFGGWGEGGGLK